MLYFATFLLTNTYGQLRTYTNCKISTSSSIYSLPDLGDKPNEPVLSAPDKRHSASP